MTAKTEATPEYAPKAVYRFDDTPLNINEGPLNYKILAIKGVRTATNLGLKKAKDLVEAAVHNGVVLSFTQAYAINAGLEFVECSWNKNSPSHDQVKRPELIKRLQDNYQEIVGTLGIAPRLIVVDQPLSGPYLDFSERF